MEIGTEQRTVIGVPNSKGIGGDLWARVRLPFRIHPSAVPWSLACFALTYYTAVGEVVFADGRRAAYELC